MLTSDQDLELLETYLDGQLDTADAQLLARRLETDAQLSATLAELQSQRSVRQMVWTSLEGDDAGAQRLNWRIQGAMANAQRATHSSRWSVWRIAQIGSAAAACAVFGFFAGWVGRSNHASSVVVNPPMVQPVDNTLTVNTNPSNTSPNIKPAPSSPIMVPVTNEYGQVVAWQQFQNADDAKNFTEDLHRANGAATATPPDDKIKLMSDEKF
jgi:anti-sigma factor RsiW